MLQYPVWHLGISLVWLSSYEHQLIALSVVDRTYRDSLVEPSSNQFLTFKISHCQEQCEALELSASLDRIKRLSAALRSNLTNDRLRQEIRVLRETIESELKCRRFAFVPTEKAKRLDEIDSDWSKVQQQFPSAKADIRDAVECYALDCNTACVFHSMRVAERGLRVLAETLGITKIGKHQHPLEFAEWGPILSALRVKLTALQQSPGRGPKKAALSKFYADAASQADYLNEIWRKEVSHARGQYNAPEAFNALTRTHDFMDLLASRISRTARKRY